MKLRRIYSTSQKLGTKTLTIEGVRSIGIPGGEDSVTVYITLLGVVDTIILTATDVRQLETVCRWFANNMARIGDVPQVEGMTAKLFSYDLMEGEEQMIEVNVNAQGPQLVVDGTAEKVSYEQLLRFSETLSHCVEGVEKIKKPTFGAD